jgi:hypothetical protein
LNVSLTCMQWADFHFFANLFALAKMVGRERELKVKLLEQFKLGSRCGSAVKW